MESFEFELTVHLSKEDEDPTIHVEALGEAGCTDALIGTGAPGVISMQFDREGDDLLSAAMSAQEDILKAIPDCCKIELSIYESDTNQIQIDKNAKPLEEAVADFNLTYAELLSLVRPVAVTHFDTREDQRKLIDVLSSIENQSTGQMRLMALLLALQSDYDLTLKQEQ